MAVGALPMLKLHSEVGVVPKEIASTVPSALATNSVDPSTLVAVMDAPAPTDETNELVGDDNGSAYETKPLLLPAYNASPDTESELMPVDTPGNAPSLIRPVVEAPACDEVTATIDNGRPATTKALATNVDNFERSERGRRNGIFRMSEL